MSTAAIRVSGLAATPVKGLRLLPRDELTLGRAGVAENRCFYLVDERARMVNGKQIGALSQVVPEYDAETGALSLTFPDGGRASGVIELGALIETRFFSRPARGRLVLGPWSEALSVHAGRWLRLVAVNGGRVGVDRGRVGAVTLVSRASIARLAEVADVADLDARRLRMLIELEGPGAHAEDDWVGRRLRVGEALVRVHGHVGRCLVTTRDPDTGEVDLPVLDHLRSYRAGLDTTEPLALGVYGEVLEPGRVRREDSVVVV